MLSAWTATEEDEASANADTNANLAFPCMVFDDAQVLIAIQGTLRSSSDEGGLVVPFFVPSFLVFALLAKLTDGRWTDRFLMRLHCPSQRGRGMQISMCKVDSRSSQI